MDVSPSTAATPVESSKDPIKKAIDVQEQQVLKILEDSTEQFKQDVAQKTGLGNNLNISG